MARSTQTIHPSMSRANRRYDWTVIIAMSLIHLGVVLAPFTFTWSGLAVMALLIWIGAGLGITLCYHRLLTHRSFATYKPVEYLLAIIGTLNWQGGPIRWVGTHRIHHKESDQPKDPHSPEHGFMWAHVFWTCYRDTEGYNPLDAAKDLQRDKFLALLDKFFWVPQFGLAAALYAAGYLIDRNPAGLGLSWLIWGTCVRTVITYHGTWFVNSAAHTWGYRNFETTDGSRNTWWVALISFGEGWHNNHHAYQRSARHGMRWFEFDMTWLTIRLMQSLGLAWNVVVPDVRFRAKGEAHPKPQGAGTEPSTDPADLLRRTPQAG